MNPNYQISVIIPIHNRIDLIERALQSVFNQTFKAHEIIVIDDGSTDHSVEFIRAKFPNVILLSQKNSGVSSARNRGIKHATGNWIALLDSDDEWLPNKLKKQIDLLSKNPDFQICHTEEIWIRNGTRVNQMKKHKKSGGWIFNQCLALCAMSPSSILLHRAILEEFDGFDESLPACEDYDLWLKVCTKYPVLLVEQAMIHKYGGHADQLSKKYWGMDRFRIKSLDNLLQHHEIPEDNRQKAIKVLLSKIEVFVNGAIKRNKKNQIADLISLREHYVKERAIKCE